VLSAHTAFPAAKSASFLDLTPEMEQGTRHWRELGMDFDAIYSGFLGSARQISVLRQFIHDFRREDTLVLVDPVMGDHGKVYRTYTPEMCRLMGELAAQADLITPNATEAAILLEEDYANVPTTQAGMESWLARLSLDGRRSVVITGVSFAPSTVGAACWTAAPEDPLCRGPAGKGQFSGREISSPRCAGLHPAGRAAPHCHQPGGGVRAVLRLQHAGRRDTPD
jgi:pyridoxine kinase